MFYVIEFVLAAVLGGIIWGAGYRMGQHDQHWERGYFLPLRVVSDGQLESIKETIKYAKVASYCYFIMGVNGEFRAREFSADWLKHLRRI